MARPYKKRLNKRWYVDATIGKNVPIIGGTGFRAGTGTLTKRSLDSHIKKVVKTQVLEPKTYRSNLVTAATVTHNTIYTHNLFSGITQGTDEENRIGDSIGVKGCHINLTFYGASAGSTDQLHYRVMVVKSKVANAFSGLFSAALGSTDIFWDSPTELINAVVNFRQCSTLMDETYSMTPQFSGQRVDKPVKLSVKLPSTFKYDENSGALGKFYNYYLVVIPYQSRGVTGVTVVGDIIMNTVISFVDSN